MPFKKHNITLSCGRHVAVPEGIQTFIPLIGRMLKSAGVDQSELVIVLLAGRQMRALNKRTLGHDHVTDVLTFDLTDHGGRKALVVAGEIYICPAEARRNARFYGQLFERELLRYIAHGILHLCGYDDATASQRAHMQKEEDRLLSSHGDHRY
jgi:rRNA maturation RNase YbeY